jgi:hypothetical protein
MAFGEQAGLVRPLTLRDRRSFHRSYHASRARWELDGHAQELLPDEEHARPRWRVKLNGQLLREPRVELAPSFEEPGMALMVSGPRPLARSLHDRLHVVHSILYASSRSARRTSAPQMTQASRF